MEGEESRPADAELEQVTATLKASLDEACSTDVQRLDTGETIRIKEVLEIASEAASEVVSLRRRRRKAATLRPGGPSSETTIGAHRVFVDTKGVQWDAFAVLPAADQRALNRLPEPYQQGWLCFESPTEKRRLGPIPDEWQTVSDEELRRLRDAAQPVTHRTTHRDDSPTV
jgi:hypothetical protein